MNIHLPLQKPNEFEVKGDLPGVREEDVKLSVDGDVLSLSVENQGKKVEDTEEVRNPWPKASCVLGPMGWPLIMMECMHLYWGPAQTA